MTPGSSATSAPCLHGVSSEIAIRRADGRRRRNGLGALQQTDLGADLGIRSFAISIELADVDADDGRAGAVDSLIERPDLPRAGSRRQPCWKANGVGGQHVGLTGELARGLMLAFTIGAVARKQRDDDVRSERAHDRYDVSENRIARPIGPDDGVVLGVSKIVGASEVLMCAIALSFREELSGADHSEEDLALAAHEVHAVLAAVEREIGGLDMAAQREPGDERVVFIVGMRADDQHACRRSDGRCLVAPGCGGRGRRLGVERSANKDQAAPECAERARRHRYYEHSTWRDA